MEFPNLENYHLLKKEKIDKGDIFLSFHKKKRFRQGILYMCPAKSFVGCVQGAGINDTFQELLTKNEDQKRSFDVITIEKPVYFLRIEDFRIKGIDKPILYSTQVLAHILTGRTLRIPQEMKGSRELVREYEVFNRKLNDDHMQLKEDFRKVILKHERYRGIFSRNFTWEWQGNTHLQKMYNDDERIRRKVLLLNDRPGDTSNTDIYPIVKHNYFLYMFQPRRDLMKFDELFPVLSRMFFMDGFSASREQDNPSIGSWYNREYTFIDFNPYDGLASMDQFSQRGNAAKCLKMILRDSEKTLIR